MSARADLTPIRFGTDGWRALIAEDFTFANLERVAQAYSDYLAQQFEGQNLEARVQSLNERLNETRRSMNAEAGARTFVKNTIEEHDEMPPPLVVVGYDRRFLSEQFALRAAEVLSGNGLRIALFESAVPTPVVSWAVKLNQAVGGVVITASHNPAIFNGFKIKAPWGGSASPEITRAVEAMMDANAPRRRSAPSWNENEILEESLKSYREQIASYIDLERLKSAPLRVVVDSMHGSGSLWVESFLRGGTLEIETIRAERDPLFGGINPEPIDRNLLALKTRVRERKARLGLATDGDADRLGAVNERAETMTMHEVVPLILLHLARVRGMTGGVVRTFSQSVLTKRIAQAHNLKLYDTPIGFKYIADLMLKEDILIGVEESGGIGVKGHIPERDGILNCLLLLEAVIASGKTPSEMVSEMHREFGEFYFDRRDIHCEVRRGQDLVARLASQPPASVAGHAVSGVETMDGTKLLFEDESWLLFRQSGTEPALRVYSEATSKAKVKALLDEGEKLALE
ncbi:MAG TPA: phosphoglucomutase/phosphomannomutase family protein [Pyrinomonadaceae bacterium]|nr:phosphoglucomutase/phosphomannomutase family protein [Pyrinomonadaceae bacterium]